LIVGLGVDIVHVSRIRHWLANPGLMERFFHPDEIAAVRGKGNTAALSLAARFAAKEAFGKALGSGLAGLKLKEIQVINNFNGKPDILLFGDALRRLEASGGKRVHLSLTHESENAVAVVVIED
jgi:holo-[acyl-carrier protein] synthase